MARIAFTFSRLGLLLALAAAPCLHAQRLEPAVNSHYHGFTPGFIVFSGDAIANRPMRLVLTVDGNPNPHGWYFTSPSFEDHPVEGQWTEDGFTLDEKNGDRLTLHYVRERSSGKPNQPLSLDVITTLKGDWSRSSHQQPLTLTIQFARGPLINGRWYDFGTSDPAIEKNAQSFLSAVIRNNPAIAARYVDYPLATRMNGKKVKIRNRQEFISRYLQIFPAGAAEKAEGALPHDMFTRDSLAMVLDGGIWFSEKGAASIWLSP
jgi:hypothetical protein